MNSGIAAGLFTGIQVGAAFVASQIAVADTGPGLLGLLRYAIALAFVLPVLARTGLRRPSAADLPALLLLGAGQTGVMIGFLNIAVLYTSSARVAVIFATLPICTLLVDRAFNGRAIGPMARNGALLCVAGIIALIGADALDGRLGPTDILGMAAAFAGTLTVAVCSAFYGPYIERYGGPTTIVIALSTSLPILAVLGALMPPASEVQAWPALTWWLVLGVGLSSGAGYLTWFHAISKLAAAHVTGFLSLSPIAAAALSYLFLDAALPPAVWIAIACVSSGLICFARDGRSRKGTLRGP